MRDAKEIGQLEATIEYPNQSQEIGKLVLALSQAQADITGARKESINPFFKSSYADLASCWDACREALTKHKLAVIQTLDNDGDKIVVITMLAHESGQWIRSRISGKPVKNDPQGIGSAITYFRRYSLSAIVGIAQVDDDGNAASRNNKEESTLPAQTVTLDQVEELKAMLPAADMTEQIFLEKSKLVDFESMEDSRFRGAVTWLRGEIKRLEGERV